MDRAEVQKMWLDASRQLEEEAERMRCSQSVPFGLRELYDGLGESEKEHVHSILEEWLVSDDGKKRYDAGFLVRSRKIRSLRSAVERAIVKLVARPGPEARGEVEYLRRMVRELS